MMKSLLAAVGVGFGLASPAQLVFLNEFHGTGGNSISADGMVPLSDGGYMMAGFSGFNELNDRFAIWRCQADGDTLWSRSHPIPQSSISEAHSNITLLSLPGDHTLIATPGGSQMVDEFGDTLWLQGGANDVCWAGPDKWMMVWRTAGSLGTRLVDTAGTTLESHQVPFTHSSTYSARITRIGNGHFMVFSNRRTCDMHETQMLLECDNSGQFLDSLMIDGPCDAPFSFAADVDILTTEDGGFLAIGQYEYNSTIIVRGNAEGDTLWTRRYGPPSGNTVLGYPFFQASTGHELPNGHFLLSGCASPGGMSEQPAIVEVDSLGEPLCVAWFPIAEGSFSVLLNACALPGNEFAYCGRVQFGSTEPAYMFNCRIADPCLVTSLPENHPHASATLFPNPGLSTIFLGQVDRMAFPLDYAVLDASGSLARHGLLQRDQPLDVGSLPGGRYLLRLTDRLGVGLTTKLVVR